MMHRIVAVEPLPDHRLRLSYEDGYVGEVDLAYTRPQGGITAFIRDPDVFETVRISESGHALAWGDPDEGDGVDMCADALRLQAKNLWHPDAAQAHRTAAE